MNLNDHLANIWKALKEQKPLSSNDIEAVQGPSGTSYALKGGSGGGGGGGVKIHLCKILSGSGQIYQAEYYDNGINSEKTGEGPIQILQASPLDSIPVNTVLIGIELDTKVYL